MHCLRTRLYRVTGLLTAVVLLGAPAAASAVTPQQFEDQGVRELIVIREPGLTAAERADVRADAGVKHVENLGFADAEVVRAPAGQLAEALADLNRDPDVKSAEVDAPVHSTTNDSLWGVLWGLENTGQTVNGFAGTSDADIDVTTAWNTTTGTGVTVGVVDTGVQLNHPELTARVTGNAGERGGGKETNGLDDDANGFVDDWRGWDFRANDNNPSNANASEGHGTHVAGTIAAPANDGQGVAGVAPDARILPVQALDGSGGTNSTVTQAFDYAGARGARVVNASLGGPGYSALMEQAIDAHPNTLYVVAAGNDGQNNDVTPEYPCNLPNANLICVGASDSSDLAASFSNYGAASVDLFAPGVDIASAYPTNTWAYLDGTSMASPHVAGAAALIVASNPSLTTSQVKAKLLGSAESRAAFSGKSVTGGRLNAALALGLTPPPPAPPGGGGGGSTPPTDPPGGGGTPDNGGGDTSDPGWDDGSGDDGDESGEEEATTPVAFDIRRRGSASICRKGCATKTVDVRLDLPASQAVYVEYELCQKKKGRCKWVAAARQTLRLKAGENKVKLGTKVGHKTLKAGKYRVYFTIETDDAVETVNTTFTVR